MAVEQETGEPSGSPTLRIDCNTPDEKLFANVYASSRRGYDVVKLADVKSWPAIICGSGPSIAMDIEEIRESQLQGMTVFALNGAAQFLCEYGIKPDFMVMLDAREHNTQFLKNDCADRYLMASQCDAAVFDRLDELNAKVLLFHPMIEGIDGYLPESEEQVQLIGGGITVGLTALALVFTVGFREQHLYGYDSSYAEDDLYVAPQIMNSGERETLVAETCGRKFQTSPIMAKQAMEFQAFAKQLADNDCVIHVHGSGLLPTMAFAMMRPAPIPTAESEADKYRKMWEQPQYRQHSPGEELFNLALDEIVLDDDVKSVIDFGCGTGRMAKRFMETGYQVTGVDFSENCLDEDVDIALCVANLWELPHLRADFGVCCDVMEHIPTEHVSKVLDNICRSVPRAFFNIATWHDVCGMLIGESLHLTVRPAEWWEERLKENWPIVQRVGENSFIVKCKEGS